MKSLFKRIHDSTESLLSTFSYLERGIFVVAAIGIAVGSCALFVQLVQTITTPRPSMGGNFSEGVIGAPKFINPVLATSQTDKDLSKLVYSGLQRKISFGTYQDDLAVCDFNNTTVTCTLDPEAKFHDGKPVTTDDVVFTIELLKQLATRNPAGNLWLGTEIATPDNQTLVFTLPQQYSGFQDLLTLGILPKHIWNDVTTETIEDHPANLDPIGSGPYKFLRLSQKRDITKTYLASFKRSLVRPYISRITIVSFVDSEALLQAVKRGDVDNALFVQHTDIPTKLLDRVFTVDTSQIYSLFINSAKAENISDHDTIDAIQQLVLGFSQSNQWPQFLKPAHSLLPGFGISENHAILGSQEKDTIESINLDISTSDSSELIDLADVFGNFASSQSVPTSVSIFERGEIIQQAVRNRNYSVLLFGTTYNHPADVFAFWHSSQRNDPGLNITSLTSSRVDTIIESIISAHPNEITERMTNLNSVLSQEAFAIPMMIGTYQYVTKTGLSPRIGTLASPEERFATISQWYIKEQRVFTN
jgi:peptide/nickel transport system substrate-binding protein